MAVVTGQAYPVIVGGGGAGATGISGGNGVRSDSQFASILSTGGGGGGGLLDQPPVMAKSVVLVVAGHTSRALEAW
jgi:hypothetical protein